MHIWRGIGSELSVVLYLALWVGTLLAAHVLLR